MFLADFQPAKTHYRSVFVSDFHIGARHFDARACARFLRSIRCEYLYLVGDIIDGWKLKKRWHWTPYCDDVLDALLDLRDSGTAITYLPGNHDEDLRGLMPFMRNRRAAKFGLTIREKTIHTLADGRNFLVLHGDQFDTKILSDQVLKTHHALSHMMSHALADLWNLIMRRKPVIEVQGKIRRFSLAKHLSKHGRLAIQALNNFEGLIYKMIREKGLDGVICGHTHIPVIKSIRDITYANCGSWLRHSHTALAEHMDGRLELLDCPAMPENPLLPFAAPAADYHLCQTRDPRRQEIDNLIRMIGQLWPAHKPRGAGALRLAACYSQARLAALAESRALSCRLPLSRSEKYLQVPRKSVTELSFNQGDITPWPAF